MKIISNTGKEMKASKYVIKIHNDAVRWGLPEILQYYYYCCYIRQCHAQWKRTTTMQHSDGESFVSDVQGGEHMIINFKSLSNRV